MKTLLVLLSSWRQFGAVFLGIMVGSGLGVVPAAADEVFEGRVKMKITDGSTEQGIDYYVKGDLMRVETEDPRAQGGAMIMNTKEKTMLMVMPEQRMYMTMPLPDVTKNDATSMEGKEPEATGETRTILGYTAEKYVHEEDGTEIEMWATDELGAFVGLQLPEEQMQGGEGQSLAAADFFPLLVIERRNGQEQSRVEVTEVEPQTLPDSLFEAPDGFRGMNMPSMQMPR